ncbi:MAG: O-antigen ligase family protein, partial [Ignavibacteria bacterium]|nr:O-antigen ligase family protein [Ignavibacteria bacterium]
LAVLLGVNVTGRYKGYKKYAFTAIILLIIAVSLTGLRSVMLGTFILVPLMLLIGISRKEVKKGEAALILILLIITPLAVRYFISNDTGKYRIDTLLPTNNQLLLQDASVTGRMEAYKFSVEKFMESPVIGKGLGGYYKPADSTGIQGGRYPHNILLEVLVESGILGILIFGYLIFLIITKTRRMSLSLMVFFLAALYLAMFSKDIPGNSVFLLGLAFVRGKKLNDDL